MLGGRPVSRGRMRLLSAVQQGAIKPDDVWPPLTDDERRWLGLAPTRLLAETFAGDGEPAGESD
jgi:hypothetical protein